MELVAHGEHLKQAADELERAQWDTQRELRAMAAAAGIELVSCCYPLLEKAGIPQGRCVDADLIRRLRPDLESPGLKPRPTREGCGCAASRDIGAYDTCPGGCACACRSRRRAISNSMTPKPERLFRDGASNITETISPWRTPPGSSVLEFIRSVQHQTR